MFIENAKNRNDFSSVGAACKKPATPMALKIGFKSYGNDPETDSLTTKYVVEPCSLIQNLKSPEEVMPMLARNR